MFYASDMPAAKTVSITLPPDLFSKAQELAEREHRTMNELFREALQRYMQGDRSWDALLKRTRTRGRELDITGEGDVERLIDGQRRAKSQRPAPQ